MHKEHSRFHAIDHLRATMISIVMFGHAILPYMTIPRTFKDPQTHVGFDVAAVFLYGFAMPAFFVTAGFSTALIFYRKGARGLLRNRLLRILVPLIVAYIVLTPLTRAAYIFAANAATSGSIQTGLEAVTAGDWLRWGKVYHLWFLVSLLIYTAMACGLRAGVLRLAGNAARSGLSALGRLLESRWRGVYLTLAIALMMVPAYVLFGSDATTLPMQLALFGFFLFGWMLYLQRDCLSVLRNYRWESVIVALLALPAAAWSTRTRLLDHGDVQPIVGIVAGLSNSVLAAFMAFGLLSIYQSRFNTYSGFGRYVSDASYWIFLVHFPLVIAVGGAWSVTGYSALVKYLLTVSVMVPVVIGSYHVVLRRRRSRDTGG